MKKYLILFIAAIALLSCNKTSEEKHVEYMITGLTDPYSLVFMDADGKSISENVSPLRIDSEWSQEYDITEGEPVYLYVKFKENIKNSPKFSVGIIIDGKYSFQRKGWDKNTGDTIYEVKVSGIVPF